MNTPASTTTPPPTVYPPYYPPTYPPIYPPYYPPVVNNNIDAYCVINPSNAYINQDLTFSAYASGGNGSYTYSWSGTDGIYSNSQIFTGRFSSVGTKTATVTIYSGNQSITRSCTVYIQGQQTAGVTVIRTPDLGTPVSGVYLSQIPATGIDFSLKTVLFGLGLVIWSAFVAYVMISRRKMALATAGSTISKAEAFKIANMQKRGLAA